MNKAQQVQYDTLSIILCNVYHKNLPSKDRAIKISKCCKKIRDKTKDVTLYNACRSIVSAVSRGCYSDVIKSIELTELNYIKEYGL